jgi:N-acetyl sugar amidotransferase
MNPEFPPQGRRVCARCLMDTTDPDISFDADGVCNHCHRYPELARTRLFTGETASRQLESLVARIKADGRGKPYDCIIGVSGGVDSTYVAYLVRRLGLRPLAVHLDNGWNSELAVKNIERTLKKLDIDLTTHVIDWEEFRDLQLSFLKASVPDAEVPTDHAILAVLYRAAVEHGVRHVLSGTNVATEAILPLKWGYGYFDWNYIQSVHRRFGGRPLGTYPHFGLLQLARYVLWNRIRMVSILNYVPYDKQAVMKILEDELGWVYYGGKHYESIYTRFFQSYILPRKFDIDKRKAHFSNLVMSGQWTREQALAAMTREDYGQGMAEADRTYVIKKLGISEAGFEEIMALPRKTFLDYPNRYALFRSAARFRSLLFSAD